MDLNCTEQPQLASSHLLGSVQGLLRQDDRDSGNFPVTKACYLLKMFREHLAWYFIFKWVSEGNKLFDWHLPLLNILWLRYLLPDFCTPKDILDDLSRYMYLCEAAVVKGLHCKECSVCQLALMSVWNLLKRCCAKQFCSMTVPELSLCYI